MVVAIAAAASQFACFYNCLLRHPVLPPGNAHKYLTCALTAGFCGHQYLTKMRNLAILMTLALAGCSVGALNLGTTNYKGQPLSAVTARLGPPNETHTVAGQKVYVWIVGNALYECRIRAVMAGDVVDTYEGFGDVNICSQYGAVSGGLKGYE